VPSPSYRDWARRFAAGTPASKPCSPRESVPRRPSPWPGRGRPSVLSWGSRPSRALSTLVPGSVSRRVARGGFETPTTHASGRPIIAVACRDLDSDTWAREPRIRRYAASIERRVSPSSSDPAHRAPRERLRYASRQPRPCALPGFRNGASCPCPLSAAPRASLPFTARLLRRGRTPLDLEDAVRLNLSPGPPLARQAGDRTPRGARSGPPSPGGPRSA